MEWTSITLAIREIISRPAVRWVSAPGLAGDRVQVDVELDLGFGDRWIAEGQSPTGTLPVERVRLDFSDGFPGRAPVPSLRPDFSRQHAHFQPGFTHDQRPVPCIVFGDLDEFLAVRGIGGFIDQLVLWLQSAAAGTLSRGPNWEPMRRDSVRDSIACDASAVRQHLNRKAGYAFLRTTFRRDLDKDELTSRFTGTLGKRVAIEGHLKTLLVSDRRLGPETGLALVLWADKEVGGEVVTDDEFRPDDVVDTRTFLEQLDRFRMQGSWHRAIAHLRQCADGQINSGVAPLPVVLLARRPIPLPDGSQIELIGYLAQVSLPAEDQAPDEVRPLACYEDIRPGLLRRLSGELGTPSPWALLGAGSVGSNIAMHRARSGSAPTVVADKRWLRPHNAARHALYPASSGWMDHKANELSAAIDSLGYETQPVQGDHVVLTRMLNEVEGPKVDWLLNTTGSTVAREWMAGPEGTRNSRVIEAGLFDSGDVGFLTIEGAVRNPDCGELWGAIYERAFEDPGLGQSVFRSGGQLEFVALGQGCDSATMIMSDAHLGAMTAPMSEVMASASPETSHGEIHILTRSGYGLDHKVISVAPYERLPLEGLEGWEVSISPRVLEDMTADVERWPGVETGGVLVGWHSPIAQRLFVTGLVDAPRDSTRSRSEFVLGVDGLTAALADIGERTSGAVYCLGTWHSHLGPAEPSGTDRTSASVVGLYEARPMTLIVRGSDGLRAISTSERTPAGWISGDGE
ncbi:MAG: Mov34/MPN/PAD-1 family protein [Alphaproteobacteria bacterium]|nr:Mov34/MPN/PAD-1 family protein [Alphaproteobacteria bacterium]MBU4137132.1 Mov34/MPN/PAD-1 family protein [Alphaproteobacteria bacterium]